MGTNFYLHEKPPCPTCGHLAEPRHIGKSSAGWCFSLHVYPDENINDLHDWVKLFAREGAFIKDEYGEAVAPFDMLWSIAVRWREKISEDFNYSANNAVPGPNNLIRHRLSVNHCVKQGAGTWDCIVGDFS